MTTIHHIDSSAKVKGSNSRMLGQELVTHLQTKLNAHVTYRDVSQGLAFLTPDAIDGLYIPDATRTHAQRQALMLSDEITSEAIEADILVIGVPLYNFGPPASLKAWADLVARKDLTFKYTERGPQGLLAGKKAYIVVTTGGVVLGSPADHLSGWIKTFLGFIGITDVTILAAEQLAMKQTESLARVRSQIDAIAFERAQPARALENAAVGI